MECPPPGIGAATKKVKVETSPEGLPQIRITPSKWAAPNPAWALVVGGLLVVAVASRKQ